MEEVSMSGLAPAFNRSGFSRFLNAPFGRIFRIVAGGCFLAAGLIFWGQPLAILSLAWGVLPLTAGAFDVCYISAALGGPLAGKTIRATYQSA
jgi:hypothetical protein